MQVSGGARKRPGRWRERERVKAQVLAALAGPGGKRAMDRETLQAFVKGSSREGVLNALRDLRGERKITYYREPGRPPLYALAGNEPVTPPLLPRPNRASKRGGWTDIEKPTRAMAENVELYRGPWICQARFAGAVCNHRIPPEPNRKAEEAREFRHHELRKHAENCPMGSDRVVFLAPDGSLRSPPIKFGKGKPFEWNFAGDIPVTEGDIHANFEVANEPGKPSDVGKPIRISVQFGK